MKLWITRESAVSLQIGGMKRLKVWLRKPKWTLIDVDKFGWNVMSGPLQHVSFSYGEFFGYADTGDFEQDSMTFQIWTHLHDHFGCEFDNWHKSDARIRDFKLELEIPIVDPIINRQLKLWTSENKHVNS